MDRLHKTVSSLWDTLTNQVDKDSALEATYLPSATQVFLGKINPFAALKAPNA